MFMLSKRLGLALLLLQIPGQLLATGPEHKITERVAQLSTGSDIEDFPFISECILTALRSASPDPEADLEIPTTLEPTSGFQLSNETADGMLILPVDPVEPKAEEAVYFLRSSRDDFATLTLLEGASSIRYLLKTGETIRIAASLPDASQIFQFVNSRGEKMEGRMHFHEAPPTGPSLTEIRFQPVQGVSASAQERKEEVTPLP